MGCPLCALKSEPVSAQWRPACHPPAYSCVRARVCVRVCVNITSVPDTPEHHHHHRPQHPRRAHNPFYSHAYSRSYSRACYLSSLPLPHPPSVSLPYARAHRPTDLWKATLVDSAANAANSLPGALSAPPPRNHGWIGVCPCECVRACVRACVCPWLLRARICAVVGVYLAAGLFTAPARAHSG